MIGTEWWLGVTWSWGILQLGAAWLPKSWDDVPEVAHWAALARRLGTSYALACFGWGLGVASEPASTWGLVLVAAGLWLGAGFAAAFVVAHRRSSEEALNAPVWPWALGLSAAVVQAGVCVVWGAGRELGVTASLLGLGAGLTLLFASRAVWQASARGLNLLFWGTLVAGGVTCGAALGEFWRLGRAARNEPSVVLQAVLIPQVLLVHIAAVLYSARKQLRGVLAALEGQATHLLAQAAQLRRTESELFRVQSELSSKQQLAAVGELAAAIAHEVRNPLAVIVNAVSGLRRADLPSRERGMLLDIVEEESARLNRLVTDLLRFARPVNVRRARVSLADLANRCRATLKDRFDVEVRVADDPSVTTVDVDPNLFGLVFDNLVANACQAMSSGGTVQVQVDPTELNGNPAARIEIRDQGHGMERQVLERALDPFFTTRPSGTGLGLPIVQRIVDAHGGQLELDSVEGVGTRVVLIVPVRAPEATVNEASLTRA